VFFRHHTDKVIYPLLLVVLLAVISYRPKYHLRPDMPQVFSISDYDSAPKRALQRKIASAYWRSAQSNIQWKFAYGHPLPNDVPAEFTVDTKELGPESADPATRALYWRRLQQVWFLPETWKKQYEWDWTWVSDPISAGGDWIKDTWDRWFAMHGPQ